MKKIVFLFASNKSIDHMNLLTFFFIVKISV